MRSPTEPPQAIAPPLVTADGLTLYTRDWPAASTAAPQGHVLIVHGLGEHAERYATLAAELNALGWAVSSYDQRGHGQSPGRRGDLPHAHALLEDLGRAVDRARAHSPAKLVLLGHSLGGVVAARFVAEGLRDQAAAWFREVDALMLSSPALDPGMSLAQRLMLAVSRPLLPHLQVGNGLKPEWISRDAAVVRAYATDAMVHNRVTATLAGFLVDASAEVHARAAFWRVPTLLLWAGADRCVAPAGSARFAAAAPSSRVVAQVFPELYHEIFNEPERTQVVQALTEWLRGTVLARKA